MIDPVTDPEETETVPLEERRLLAAVFPGAVLHELAHYASARAHGGDARLFWRTDVGPLEQPAAACQWSVPEDKPLPRIMTALAPMILLPVAASVLYLVAAALVSGISVLLAAALAWLSIQAVFAATPSISDITVAMKGMSEV